MIAGGQVIGAVSWGIACAQGKLLNYFSFRFLILFTLNQGRPDVYARISSFRDWFIANS